LIGLIARARTRILAAKAKEKRMRAALESLLRARKLDVTLTTAAPANEVPPDRVAPTGCPELDVALGGGLRRGHLSEVTGAVSSGRTTLVIDALAAATARGEVAALVDACDTFDPPTAASHGVDLARVLWIRPSTPGTVSPSLGAGDTVARALKAFGLVLQAGGFGLVVLDLADAPAAAVRRFPWPTWMRLARIVEGSDTVALLVATDRIARSPGGATIALAVSSSVAQWVGPAPRARVFQGVTPAPRVVRAR
jgi:hypothetical protein